MTFRFARHTNNLEKLKIFYIEVLGFELLGSFENHENYDGIFIGKTGLDWHLEFTQTKELTKHVFDQDDILIFYPKSKMEYNTILENIKNQSVKIITSKNPYWNKNGKMVLDPDGYQIIISDIKT